LVLFGNACHKHAAEPQESDNANEVPFPLIIDPEEDDMTDSFPTATTFGFISPSDEGPCC